MMTLPNAFLPDAIDPPAVMLNCDTMTIVGVVASVKEEGAAKQNLVGIYEPIAQTNALPSFVTIAARVADDPRAHAAALRRVVTSLDPTVPVSDVKTMMARENESISTTRFSTFLASLFALAALVSALSGYTACSRTLSVSAEERSEFESPLEPGTST